MKSGRFEIVTDAVVRDPRMERRIVEMNRDRILYTVLLLGAVLILIAVIY